MKVVILAGGFGTRISEESHLKPKPMIEIGEKPILWHIMKEYSAYGINEFIICAGYKQHVIKEWFADYFIHTSDITFDFTKGNEMIIHNKHAEPWKVTVVDTGLNTQTGGRIKRVKDFVGDDTFMVTYGDAVGDINIDELLAFHRAHGKIGTMSMYNFGQTKGIVDVGNNGIINAFREKSDFDGDLINIGYMVFEPALFDYIEGDSTIFENKGVSLLFFNNDRALERFDSFKEMLKYQEISVTDAVRQPNLKGHSVIPKNVNAFWRDFQKKGIGYCISFYSPAGIPFRIKRKIKYIYSKVTRK